MFTVGLFRCGRELSRSGYARQPLRDPVVFTPGSHFWGYIDEVRIFDDKGELAQSVMLPAEPFLDKHAFFTIPAKDLHLGPFWWDRLDSV